MTLFDTLFVVMSHDCINAALGCSPEKYADDFSSTLAICWLCETFAVLGIPERLEVCDMYDGLRDEFHSSLSFNALRSRFEAEP